MKLTEDERILLEIAYSGAPMIPIGKWENAIHSLAAVGYLKALDSVNYVITPEGRKAWEAWEKAETEELKAAFGAGSARLPPT